MIAITDITPLTGTVGGGFFRDRLRKEKLYEKIDFLQRHRHEAENIEFDEWYDVRAEAKKGGDKN
ncbi:MAG: hypothetical protein WAM14_11475 [Candidatus Nitrosopolaris sp.]